MQGGKGDWNRMNRLGERFVSYPILAVKAPFFPELCVMHSLTLTTYGTRPISYLFIYQPYTYFLTYYTTLHPWTYLHIPNKHHKMVKITSTFVAAAAFAAVSAQTYVLYLRTWYSTDKTASQTSLLDVPVPSPSLLLVISDHVSRWSSSSGSLV